MPNEFITTEGTNPTYLTHLINRKRDLEWTMSTKNRTNSTNYTLLCTKDKASPIEGKSPKAWRQARTSAGQEFRSGSGCCDPGGYASVLQKSEASLISGMLPEEGSYQNQIANLSLYKNKRAIPNREECNHGSSDGPSLSEWKDLEARTPVTW